MTGTMKGTNGRNMETEILTKAMEFVMRNKADENKVLAVLNPNLSQRRRTEMAFRIVKENTAVDMDDLLNLLLGDDIPNLHVAEKIDNEKPRRNKPWTNTEKNTLQRFVNDGHDIEFIAKRMGRTKQAIRNAILKFIPYEKTEIGEVENDDD